MKTNLFIKVTLLVFIFTFFSISPCLANDYALYEKNGHRSSSWDSLVKASFESFDSGDIGTGLLFMQKAYDKGCKDGLLLLKISLYYELNKDYKKAIDYLTQASPALTKQYPSYEQTKRLHEHFARLYYQTDQYDKALPEIELALKDNLDNFTLLFILGQIYLTQKDNQKAVQAFELALRCNDKSRTPAATMTIAAQLMITYYELQDFEKSLFYAERILESDPSNQTALSYKQRIQKDAYQKKEKEAIEKMVQ